MNPPWSLNLIFMLGYLAPWVSSSEDTISPKMRADVNKLKRHYRTSGIALHGSPLFPQDLDNFEENEQKLVLQESLDVYNRILSKMLNGTQDREIIMSITSIRAKMEDMRKIYSHSREQALMRRLHEMWALKPDDETTQRKALRELLMVFQSASRRGRKIQEKTERRRRRCQSLGGRVPQQ